MIIITEKLNIDSNYQGLCNNLNRVEDCIFRYLPSEAGKKMVDKECVFHNWNVGSRCLIKKGCIALIASCYQNNYEYQPHCALPDISSESQYGYDQDSVTRAIHMSAEKLLYNCSLQLFVSGKILFGKYINSQYVYMRDNAHQLLEQEIKHRSKYLRDITGLSNSYVYNAIGGEVEHTIYDSKRYREVNTFTPIMFGFAVCILFMGIFWYKSLSVKGLDTGRSIQYEKNIRFDISNTTRRSRQVRGRQINKKSNSRCSNFTPICSNILSCISSFFTSIFICMMQLCQICKKRKKFIKRKKKNNKNNNTKKEHINMKGIGRETMVL